MALSPIRSYRRAHESTVFPALFLTGVLTGEPDLKSSSKIVNYRSKLVLCYYERKTETSKAFLTFIYNKNINR